MTRELPALHLEDSSSFHLPFHNYNSSSVWTQNRPLFSMSADAREVTMDVAMTEPVRAESPSPSITITTSSWTSLPVEIRQMILRLVCPPIPGRPHKGSPGSSKVARFAAVCQEWQVFFEACTFRRLVVDPDSVDEFDAVMKRDDTRLGYIRKLWLRVQLPKYDCPDCDKAEDHETGRRYVLWPSISPLQAPCSSC